MIQAAKIIGTGLAIIGLVVGVIGMCTGYTCECLCILFVVFTLGVLTITYLYGDYLQLLLNKGFLSLEWFFNSPPKPHAFSGLPVNSMPLLNFVFNGAVVVTCIQYVINGVIYYGYFSEEGALVILTTIPLQ